MSKLIEKIWYESHCATFFVAPFLWPLSRLFGIVARKRRAQFIQNPEKSYKAPIPVIIVGNISIGGNGKTPVVLWLVEQLRAKGMKPGVISRGYGGKASSPLLLNSKTSTQQAGDEPVLIFQRTSAPVVVSPNREQAIKLLLTQDVDIIISDDGLQHYKLARDLEIVVIDANRRFGNGHYIPFGPLRELPSRIDNVDIVICNGGKAQEGEEQMHLIPSEFVNVRTGHACGIEQLKCGVAIAGIGSPLRFFTTLEQFGVTLSQKVPLADHQDFSEKKLLALEKMAQPVFMTEKDAVKCREYAKNKSIDHWWYLPVDAHFSSLSTQRILQKIEQIKDIYGSSSA